MADPRWWRSAATESASTSPMGSTHRGTTSSIRMAFAAGWPRSTCEPAEAWSWIAAFSWSPTPCGRTRSACRAATHRPTRTATPESEVVEEVAMEWNAMLALGAYHGINPGMGWLFAVALGMQRRSARGVWSALLPIALGHAVAVAAVVVLAAMAGVVVPLPMLRTVNATMLITIGSYRLWRHQPPRFGGMQVGFRDLTVWSFLMASAHGAGFMLLPWVMTMPAELSAAAHDHAAHAIATGAVTPWVGLVAVGA